MATASRSALRLLLFATLLLVITACDRSSLKSPMEITMRFGLEAPVVEKKARITVSVHDVEEREVAVRVTCDEEQKVIRVGPDDASEEVCGIQFLVLDFNYDGTEPRNVRLRLTWDDGRGQPGDEGSAQPAAEGSGT